MKMSPEGRTALDDVVNRIMARHFLAEPERAGIHYELMSHLHSGAEKKASEAGRDEIQPGDVSAAVADAGGEAALEQAFVAPLSKARVRAGFWRRAGAYVVDIVILFAAIGAVQGALFAPFWIFGATAPFWDPVDVFGEPPWAAMWPFAIPFWFGFGFLAVAGELLYFSFLELRWGQTLGKKVLRIRVLRLDGKPLTWREVLIRNVAKAFGSFILFLDALFIVFAPDKKQRASDMLAETIVVKE
ncbi:MAG: RDD family protein [Methanobacteriota archaeon]